MTLQQLRAFLAIVELGSFRRAARELDLSQAGLSNSLQALEAALGVLLLQRSSQGVTLTEDGKRLLARAHLIDREARRAVDEANSSRNVVAGNLHIGFGPTPTAVLLPHVVPDFHARYPDVKLKFTSGFYEQLGPSLQQGLIELAVTALPDEGAPPGMESSMLFQSELVVVARRGHPHASAKSLSQLADDEWILVGSPGGPGGTITRFFAEQALPSPKVAATCESFTQLAALIQVTDWLALLPAVMVDLRLLGVDIEIIRIRERAHKFDNCIVYRSQMPLTPAAAAFALMCQSCARMMVPGETPKRRPRVTTPSPSNKARTRQQKA
jgi:LysR family transcriptional regulator of abg operon